MRRHADTMHFHRMLASIWQLVADSNAYIDEQAPWGLKTSDPERMKTVLYVLAETIRCIAIAVQPVVPQGACTMLDQLKVPQEHRQYQHINANYALKPGVKIDKPQGIFPRIIEEKSEGAAA